MDTKPYIQHNPKVGYIYSPDTCLDLHDPEGKSYRLTINQDGLRSNKRYSLSKPPHTFRILAFGDSYCAGQYLNNNDRFSEQMEKLCPGLEVLNFGLEGTGTDQQLLLFEHYGMRYDFDLVMVCPFIENIRRNMASYRVALDPITGQLVLVPKPRFELVGDHLETLGVPVPAQKIPFKEAGPDLLAQTDFGGSNHNPSALGRIKDAANKILVLSGLKNVIYRTIPHEPFPEYKNPSSPAWLLMAAILKHFKELARAKPLVIVPLVYVSYMYYSMASHYIDRFRSLEENDGVYFIDTLPYFRRLLSHEIDRCFLANDCHYSFLGHGILARALVAELKSRNLIPENGVPKCNCS